MPSARSHPEQRAHHLAVDVGEAKVATGVAVGQSLVIESHQMQNRSVKVVHMNWFLHCAQAMFIGRPMHDPGLEGKDCIP